MTYRRDSLGVAKAVCNSGRLLLGAGLQNNQSWIAVRTGSHSPKQPQWYLEAGL